MKITLDATDCKIELGDKGILLTIADAGNRPLGQLRVGNAAVRWRRLRPRRGVEKTIKLDDLLKLLDER